MEMKNNIFEIGKGKGIVVTTTMLVYTVFLVIGVMIVILIFLSLTRQGPSAISDFFFRMFDFTSALS